MPLTPLSPVTPQVIATSTTSIIDFTTVSTGNNPTKQTSQSMQSVAAQHQAYATGKTVAPVSSHAIFANSVSSGSSSSNSISKSNSLVNVLNFSKRKSLFNKLNSSDHNISSKIYNSAANTPVTNTNMNNVSSSSAASVVNKNLNSSVSSFGTIKIKDKKFFNILTTRPKFLDTPKPQQQQIMPPPTASLQLASSGNSSAHLLVNSKSLIKSANSLLGNELGSAVSVDLNGNNIKNKNSNATGSTGSLVNNG